jgi:hypothetical protein
MVKTGWGRLSSLLRNRVLVLEPRGYCVQPTLMMGQGVILRLRERGFDPLNDFSVFLGGGHAMKW